MDIGGFQSDVVDPSLFLSQEILQEAPISGRGDQLQPRHVANGENVPEVFQIRIFRRSAGNGTHYFLEKRSCALIISYRKRYMIDPGNHRLVLLEYKSLERLSYEYIKKTMFRPDGMKYSKGWPKRAEVFFTATQMNCILLTYKWECGSFYSGCFREAAIPSFSLFGV